MSIYLLSPTAKETTEALPMIEFRLLALKLVLNDIDILMFTSKQAVKSAEALDPLWKNIPCLAIGKATAKMIESLGGKVLYQPKDFYAKSLNQDILTHFKHQKILYLRPKTISFDSKAFLKKHNINIEEQIIYETSCIVYEQNQKPPNASILIFTSPSTIKCFLKNFSWESSYIAIVIGKATQKYLPKDAEFRVADVPTIEACVLKAKSLRTPMSVCWIK